MKTNDITREVALRELANGAFIFEYHRVEGVWTDFFLVMANGDEIRIHRTVFLRLNRRDEIERINHTGWKISSFGMKRVPAEAMR